MSSLATCLAINAIFYGMTFETPATESATVLFVTIVAAIVPMVGKLWFTKGRHKIQMHTSRKQEKLIEANKDLKRINYWVGCYFCCYCRKDLAAFIQRDKIEENRRKLEFIKPMPRSNEIISKSSNKEITKPFKAIRRSMKKTFTPFSHEDTYLFNDQKAERTIARFARVGRKDNPFISVHDIFHYFDLDGCGHISRDELKEALCFLQQSHGKEGSGDLVQGLLDVIEEDILTFDKFETAMIQYFRKLPLDVVFNHFDPGDSGFITTSEFQEVLRSLGIVSHGSNLDSLLKEIDLD
jgi:Ca2+-binding EF-hand superfamily protein